MGGGLGDMDGGNMFSMIRPCPVQTREKRWSEENAIDINKLPSITNILPVSPIIAWVGQNPDMIWIWEVFWILKSSQS